MWLCASDGFTMFFLVSGCICGDYLFPRVYLICCDCKKYCECFFLRSSQAQKELMLFWVDRSFVMTFEQMELLLHGAKNDVKCGNTHFTYSSSK